MLMTSQIRKETSPPNKPSHRIGGKRRPPPGYAVVSPQIEGIDEDLSGVYLNSIIVDRILRSS
jgi:hypothetical protein